VKYTIGGPGYSFPNIKSKIDPVAINALPDVQALSPENRALLNTGMENLQAESGRSDGSWDMPGAKECNLATARKDLEYMADRGGWITSPDGQKTKVTKDNLESLYQDMVNNYGKPSTETGLVSENPDGSKTFDTSKLKSSYGGMTVPPSLGSQIVKGLIIAGGAAITGLSAAAVMGAGAGAGAALPSDLLTVGGAPLTTAQAGSLTAGLGAPTVGAGATGLTVSAGGVTGALPASTAGAITVPGATIEGLGPVAAGGAGSITTTGGGSLINRAIQAGQDYLDNLGADDIGKKLASEAVKSALTPNSQADAIAADTQAIDAADAQTSANKSAGGLINLGLRQGYQPLTYRDGTPVYTNGILNRRPGP